ncbi:hypothetical protein [Corynebacterium liangguodongii]|uniref:hypothetical protein n=1 Tax=Corynebacterium liangguodongii TaxID=2079535 RepID=UPI0011B23466|nr:hypothetical protein [Corynebacterium liangguodongii]
MKNFTIAAGLAFLTALACAVNTPTASAQVEANLLDASERVRILSSGESMKISNDEPWESIIAELPQTHNAKGATTTYAGDLAPSCINAVWEKGFVQVYNNCGFDLRIKVVMAFAPDSACHLVVDGTRHNISFAWGRIDRVELC